MEAKREQRPELPNQPGTQSGSVDVVGHVPEDVGVDPYITEGHAGYDETGPSEIISPERLAGKASEKATDKGSEKSAGKG